MRTIYIRDAHPGQLVAAVADVLRCDLPGESPEEQALRVFEALGIDPWDVGDPLAESESEEAVQASYWQDAQGIMANRSATDPRPEDALESLESLRLLTRVLRGAMGDNDWMTGRSWTDHVQAVREALPEVDRTWELMLEALQVELSPDGGRPLQASIEDHTTIRGALKALTNRES